MVDVVPPGGLVIRKGLETNRLALTGKEGELASTTDEQELYLHDGVTAGGRKISRHWRSLGASQVLRFSDRISLAATNITLTLPDVSAATHVVVVDIADPKQLVDSTNPVIIDGGTLSVDPPIGNRADITKYDFIDRGASLALSYTPADGVWRLVSSANNWVVPNVQPLPPLTTENEGKLAYKGKTLIVGVRPHAASKPVQNKFYTVGTKYIEAPLGGSGFASSGDFVIMQDASVNNFILPPTTNVEYQMVVTFAYGPNFDVQIISTVNTNGDDPAITIEGVTTSVDMDQPTPATFVWDPLVDSTRWKIIRAWEFPDYYLNNTATNFGLSANTGATYQRNITADFAFTVVNAVRGRDYYLIIRNQSFSTRQITLPASIRMGVATNPVPLPPQNFLHLHLLAYGTGSFTLMNQVIDQP